MDKLKMTSKDKVQENIQKLRELFPNAVHEELRDGAPTLTVDFEELKQELASVLTDDRELRYQFTWPDKQKAELLTNTPVSATLRPCKEDSVDFDSTQNLYIEGDNLDVLKLLQETYLGKIKMIYIDPPYNTGNDFVYNDDFAQNSDEYIANSGQYDDYGNRLVQNTESNGRFHTNWLNMMYPRLRLAKDLLADDGVIFISIDDNEVNNLGKLCEEIFGAKNFVNNFMWLHGKGKKDKQSRTLQQYVLCYAKCKDNLGEWTDEVFTNYEFDNPDNDPNGKWFSGSLSFSEERSNPKHPNYYAITSPSGVVWTRQWQVPHDEMEELLSNGDVFWGDEPEYDAVPRLKIRPGTIDVIPGNILDDCGTTKSAETDLKKLMDNAAFDYPKPVGLIRRLISFIPDKEGVYLDFFSGSGTTAHAVMQQNVEDEGKRKFILVQLPENLDDNISKQNKPQQEKTQKIIDFLQATDKPHTLTEYGKERIRRAGKKIKQENGEKAQNLDIGFRALKLDSSNMKPVYYKAEEYAQSLLSALEDNIRADRTPLDLLFQVMLELGKPLSAKIEEKEIAGKKVFIVDDNDLIACFDTAVTDEAVKTIAQLKPMYAVFRDSGLSSDSTAANFDQIFATYSPNTTRKVL